MRKKIRFFRQHTDETCGISCILMLLDYYDRDLEYPTQKLEEELYSHYKVPYFKGVTGAAIAHCLSRNDHQVHNNLQVHLVQSFQDRMENQGDLFTPEELEMIIDSHRSHLKKCQEHIAFSPGTDFDSAFLARQLEAGKKIILECFVPVREDEPPSVLHWMLLDGYKNGEFKIRDPSPKGKPLYYTGRELEARMDTPIGKICIIVGEPND